jgi:NAD(P)-dependent dehydrogenase (short-subunit alcohol dehydrogenase family)
MPAIYNRCLRPSLSTAGPDKSMTNKVAVVTGANRGIGLEICRQLAQHALTVILTSRHEAKGQAARATLAAAGLTVDYRRLDVTNAEDIAQLEGWLLKQHGGADVLVNNAGVMLDPRGSRLLDADPEVYRRTFEINVLGPLQVTKALLPQMKNRNYGRIVNVSSGQGQLAEMGSGTPAYRIAKTALNALTRITAAETRAANILVNSMCPGWVRTDMGGPSASRSVEQGADTALWLATLPDGGPTGGFFRDRKPIAW